MMLNRCHPVIRENREGHLGIDLLGQAVQTTKFNLVPLQALLQQAIISKMHMEEHIYLAEVEEKEAGLSGLQVTSCLFKDLFVCPFAVGIDAGWNLILLHVVKDRECTGDAAGCVKVALFHPIEPWKNSRADAALKRGAEPEQSPARFLKELASNSIIQQLIWQE